MHTDLEGVTGLDDVERIDSEKPDLYRRTCESLMLDINVAVAGAFDGGADHVTVADGHGGQDRHNFILDMLDERAEYDTRPNRHWWGILDESYDASFFVGAHAMAGTMNGFLDHTMSFSVLNWYLNGRRIGELTMWAIVAGAFGVPLVMVSGDEAACAEARAFFAPVETAAVKQGVGRNRAIAYPADEARARISEAARQAIQLVGKAEPYRPTWPREVRIEYARTDYADAGALRGGAERLDARTIRKVSSEPLFFGYPY
jgi:D-amino peptidase